MSDVTINQLEGQLEEMKRRIARRDEALQLGNNPLFRKLILEEFCTQECARYAQASADPALSAEARADSLAIAQAAGHLRRYMSVIMTMGNQAEATMDRMEAEIEAARAEDAEEHE